MVYGTPNASIVMAAFLHVAPGRMRFNGSDLGAWYASDDIRTEAAEVGHHLRREAVARNVAIMRRHLPYIYRDAARRLSRHTRPTGRISVRRVPAVFP